MRKNESTVVVSALLLATMAMPDVAAAQRDATRRFTTDQRGDITFAANSIVSCRDGSTGAGVGCAAARAATGGTSINNDFPMELIDADSDLSTFDSSGATLTLPAGSSVSFAGLYWYCTDQAVGDPAPVPASRNVVRMRPPGGSYANVTASIPLDDIGDTYQGFADVTTQVTTAGAGEYFVGNIQCANSIVLGTTSNLRGGWALVVVYADAAQPLRNLVVYDAFRSYGTTATTITVSDFLTPPSPEPVSSRIGVVFYDGDRGLNDQLALRCTLPTPGAAVLLGETAAGALNPTTDIGNSTVTRFAAATTRTPAYANTLGFDADIFATTNALPNSCRTATITASTSAEAIELGVVTFATDIYAPDVTISKTASDVNGGTLLPGDVLEYTLTATNNGRDPALAVIVRDTIPTGTTYVPGSLRIGAATRTDAAGDDTAFFGGGQAVFHIGTGATAAAGGRIDVGAAAAVTVRFQVRVNTGLPGGTILSNTATATYNGLTLGSGTTFTSDSDSDPGTSGPQPTDVPIGAICGDNVVTAPETCDGGNATPGDGCNATCRREVAITAPTNGTITTMLSSVSGTGDVGAMITVRIDGTVVGMVTVGAGGTWTVPVAASLADGPHTVLASSVDGAGGSSSAMVTVTTDTATTVAILVPTEGSSTNDTTPTISGTAEPGATVVVRIDGTVVGMATASAGGTWSVTPTTPLSAAMHTATATATDSLGNTAMAMRGFIVDVSTTVAISLPAEGSTVSTTTPAISGTAEAGATVVVRVDGTVVGMATATGGTWSVTPTTPLSQGSHTAVATATDAAGNVATDSQTFTVDTVTNVAITVPAEGSTTNDSTPTISGTAEAGAMVSVSVDGTVVATTMATAGGTWSVTVAAALVDGPHVARATATDAGGATATDDQSFIVDTVTTVAITSPAEGETLGDATPTFTGTAEAGASVQISVDGSVVATVTATGGTFSFTPSTPLTEGSHTVTAQATDGAGNTATDTHAFELDLSTTVAITSPTDGASLTSAMPTITGTAEAGATVQIVVDGTPVGTATADASGNFGFPLTSPLTDGPHTIVANATDAAGNTASDSIDVTVDTSTVVAITSPTDGARAMTSMVTVTGTGEPGSTITLTIDGAAAGTATVAADGTWSIVTGALADGPHTVVATATDAGGATATDEVTFTVDTMISVAITEPEEDEVVGTPLPTLSGTSDPGASIVISIDGTEVGTVTADAAGNWTFTTSDPLADGAHTISVVASDDAGNEATATSTFDVDTVVPALLIVQPGEGTTTSDTTPDVTGTSEPGLLVTVRIDGVFVATVTVGVDGRWSTTAAVLSDGPHTVTATTTDAGGNTASDEHDFVVDGTAPAIAIVTPADGSVLSVARPDFTGTAEPGASVEVLVDGVLIATVTAASDGTWSTTAPDDLTEGPHVVVATARDASGNVASDTHGFTVDLSTTVTITIPEDGDTVGSATPTFAGTGEPGATVTLSVDGTEIADVTVGADGTWSFIATDALAEGPHTLTAVAVDASGNTDDDEVSFTVDTGIGDADGDGVLDGVECPTMPCRDTDMDGMPDRDDPDDDGDGIPTAVERPGAMDVDTDDDDLPDYLDPDDDGDGVPTRTEAPGGVTRDSDGDGLPDHRDIDDDGDGLPTRDERPGDVDVDTDDDDLPDYLDPDDDDDGIPTARERADGVLFGNDPDDDDTDNWLDLDSDGDGLSDEEEGIADIDMDGIPDYLDPLVEVPDAGMPDGGVDGGIADAGPVDAGDGGDLDAGISDGGESDASPDAARPTGGGISGGALGGLCSASPARSTSAEWAFLALVGLALTITIRRKR